MIAPPQASEYNPYYSRYLALVQGTDLTDVLDTQMGDSLQFLRGITEEKSLRRYEPGKWSIKEVLGHLIDAERIFSYRALRFARNDQTPLPGFDQDPYVAAAGFDSRPWNGLVDEFEQVRRATISFFRGLSPEAATRSGKANDSVMSVRAAGYVIAGHELHHMHVLRDKYI